MIQSLIILLRYLKEEVYLLFWKRLGLEFLFGFIWFLIKVLLQELDLGMFVTIIKEEICLVISVILVVDFFLLMKKLMVLENLVINSKFKSSHLVTFFLMAYYIQG